MNNQRLLLVHLDGLAQRVVKVLLLLLVLNLFFIGLFLSKNSIGQIDLWTNLPWRGLSGGDVQRAPSSATSAQQTTSLARVIERDFWECLGSR